MGAHVDRPPRALALLFAGVQVVRNTPTDVLPSADLPVISVVWTYSGLPAQQMEAQVTQFSEFSIAGNTADVAPAERHL